MIALLARKLGWLLLACLLFLHAIERFNPNPPQLLIHADYQRCVTVHTEPLLRSPRNAVDYRVGERFNDKGIS